MLRSGTLRSGTLRSGTLRSGTLRSGTLRSGTLRSGTLACALAALAGCGAKQASPASDNLIERVCLHAMEVAKTEEIGDFTMEQCRGELQKRSELLHGGFRGWANCLLQMDSIAEAKLTCRESDYFNPS